MKTNEYGVPLDRNGYAPSILQTGEGCFLCRCCGGLDPLDRHEVFGGANRAKSKRLGLWVNLCHHRCHIFGSEAVHRSADTALGLKRAAQRAAMAHYGWTEDDFRLQFDKSYL